MTDANLSREMSVPLDVSVQSMAAFIEALEPFVQGMAALTDALNEAFKPVFEDLRMNYPSAFDESGKIYDDWIHRVSNQQSHPLTIDR